MNGEGENGCGFGARGVSSCKTDVARRRRYAERDRLSLWLQQPSRDRSCFEGGNLR